MSSKLNSRDSRRTQRSEQPTKPQTCTKVISQRDLDSSAHRLSRVPQRFQSKVAQNDKTEPFAVSYFKNNPEEAKDIRSPQEKLNDIELSLSGNQLEPSEKFSLLMQQKALRFLSFGETSKEAFDSYYSLGEFYNQQKRAESALRHLQKAKSLLESSGFQITENEKVLLAVEISEAHIMQNNKSQADESIGPHLSETISDPEIRFKRDFLAARLLSLKCFYKDSLMRYESAINAYLEASCGKSDEIIAQIYLDASKVAKKGNNDSVYNRYVMSAYQIFTEHGNQEMSEELAPQIKSLSSSPQEPLKTDEDFVN